MYKKFFFLIFFTLTIFLYNNSSVLASPGTKIADTGARIACGESPVYAYTADTRIYDSRTSKYVDLREQVVPMNTYIGINGKYASCDTTASTIVRGSGVDPNFEPFLVPRQLNYVRGNSDWKHVGTYYKGTNPVGILKPGDVLIVDPALNPTGEANMHIWVYLGNEAVQKYFPGSRCDSVEGSYGFAHYTSYYPWLFVAEDNGGDSRPYAIWRYKSIDIEPIIKWGETDDSITFDNSNVDICAVITDDLGISITNIFFYISVAGVILLFVMTLISGVKAITSSKENALFEFLQSIAVRIIVLILLLLLPAIISTLIDAFNKIAPSLGFEEICEIDDNKEAETNTSDTSTDTDTDTNADTNTNANTDTSANSTTSAES